MTNFSAEDLGIPILDLELQALDLPAPVVKWGTIARTRPMPGTYHFYTDDYKFRGIRPNHLPTVGCAAAVEVNFSTSARKPVAEVLGDICRKRMMAREWQAHRIKIVVDLNVDPVFRELNYLGVPKGWRSYAVRSQHGIGWDEIEADHARALQHADGQPIVFAIFGGGKLTALKCEQAGWIHVPEHLHVVEGRAIAYGQGAGRPA